MKPYDVKEMLKKLSEVPVFFINFQNVGRGIVGDKSDENSAYIKHTKLVNCWRILGDKLQKVEDADFGLLFDEETYIFQWIFELATNDAVQEESLFYYWKGSNATKGYSPLPPEIVDQDIAVERICQWSEPALFFHMFSKPLIVFSGSYKTFDPQAKKLFIVKGEMESELHLYEVPCLRRSLRSRGIFILLNPNESSIYYWYGAAISNDYEKLVKNVIQLNQINENWLHYKTIEVKDGHEDGKFLEVLGSQTGNYFRLSNCLQFTPRLFYFNSITGEFLATEIQYPLRSKEHIAPFPFLQSHLYTADQPALFLLDNEKELWLWEGWNTPESNSELFETQLKLAQETAHRYAKEKGVNQPLPVKHALAGLEPLDFINIFPLWIKREDVAQMQQKI